MPLPCVRSAILRRTAAVLLALVPMQLAHASTTPARLSGIAPPREVRVVTHDYSFDMPDTLQAGVTTFRLHNEGQEAHHLMFLRLDDGKELRDVVASLAEPKAHPAWMHAFGGPNGVTRTHDAVVTFELPAGRYAVVCVIPSPDHIGHAGKGMAKIVTVQPATARAERMPSGDVTIALKEYGFEFSHPITTGHHRIEIVNQGKQLHELILLRMVPGKHATDFVKWAQSHDGPSPGERFGGVTDIAPGAKQLIDVDLPAGDYGLICRVRDAADGNFHDQHGMTMDIKVSSSTP